MSIGRPHKYDADGYVTGYRLGELAGKPITDHGTGRRCAREGCNAKLNRYNAGPNCHRCGQGDDPR
jgi:hypothetical protein